MEPIEITLSSNELREIDAWRAELKIESRAEAIRRLVKLGLKAEHDESDADPIIAA